VQYALMLLMNFFKHFSGVLILTLVGLHRFLKFRCAIVRAVDRCTVCDNTLLIRNFYVFPCGHKFHADCLLSEVYPTLTEPRKKLLHEHQVSLRLKMSV